MGKWRFSGIEIVYGVKPVRDKYSDQGSCPKYDVCENTVYQWRKKLRWADPEQTEAGQGPRK